MTDLRALLDRADADPRVSIGDAQLRAADVLAALRPEGRIVGAVPRILLALALDELAIRPMLAAVRSPALDEQARRLGATSLAMYRHTRDRIARGEHDAPIVGDPLLRDLVYLRPGAQADGLITPVILWPRRLAVEAQALTDARAELRDPALFLADLREAADLAAQRAARVVEQATSAPWGLIVGGVAALAVVGSVAWTARR